MGANVSCKNDYEQFTIFLSGRIDTTNAAEAESDVMQALEANSGLVPVIDMSELEYISSAGLRVLMKLRKKLPETPEMINVSKDVYDILETTGFTELFEVSRKKRQISVDGCEIIGRGFYGTVYRIDEETIVKVYETPDSLAMIKNEKEMARTALVAGVPTAISYDIVQVGKCYGSVFEMLNAKTLNDLLIEQPENSDAIIKMYAEFLRLVNGRTVPAGKLRSAKQQFSGYLDVAAKYLDAELHSRLKKMFDEIPEEHGVIHGDSQMKNIMVQDGEPFLIDMDTLCEGNAIFDLQSVYVTYFAFGEDDPANSMDFLGIPKELSDKVWRDFIGYYFETDDEAKLAALRDKISIMGCIRFIFLIDLISDHDSELFIIRIMHTAQRLRELLERTDDLLLG